MMRLYARAQVFTLLRSLEARMHEATKLRDVDSIHDLRVAIRRFQQGLQIFRQFVSGGYRKKIRRRLRKIMQLSGEIRNRDIALDLLRQAGLPARSTVPARLLRERKQFQNELLALFDRWGKRNLSRKWGSRLGL
jgi:CHAD domain-containing protein